MMPTRTEHWTNKVTTAYRLFHQSIRVSFFYYEELLEFYYDGTGLTKGIRTIFRKIKITIYKYIFIINDKDKYVDLISYYLSLIHHILVLISL